MLLIVANLTTKRNRGTLSAVPRLFGHALSKSLALFTPSARIKSDTVTQPRAYALIAAFLPRSAGLECRLLPHQYQQKHYILYNQYE